MKDKEFKNWKYIVLIVLLCIIILLLSLVLFKVTNKNKEDNNLDKVSDIKIDDKLYKTFNRKDFKVLKNLKDNYVVRDMKLVQSDNSFSSIKLNNKEVGIRYVIYQEENENKKNNIYYRYYLELYFNNSKLNRVMKILYTSDSFSKLGSIKLDNINFNKIVGLDYKEYLIINYNVLNNNYSLGRNYVYVLNDEFKIIYEVPFISGEELF